MSEELKKRLNEKRTHLIWVCALHRANLQELKGEQRRAWEQRDLDSAEGELEETNEYIALLGRCPEAHHMNKPETLDACGWPDLPFTFHDEPGEHDPCYVVMPGGCSLALNHCAPGMMDINRAKFIIDACNAALAKLEPARTPGFIRNPNPCAPPWEREKNPK